LDFHLHGRRRALHHDLLLLRRNHLRWWRRWLNDSLLRLLGLRRSGDGHSG
jgi:hypothetical protein